MHRFIGQSELISFARDFIQRRMNSLDKLIWDLFSSSRSVLISRRLCMLTPIE